MRRARAESRVRSKSRRKGTRRHMPTNNNNSDSGYFAYSNNQMPFLVFLPLQISHRGTELEARARTLRPKADASRFAWQVTRNLFACQRTRLSPLIPPSKLLSSLEEIYLPAVYLELLLMLPLSTGLAARWPSKANSDSNPTFIAGINSFNGLILNI